MVEVIRIKTDSITPTMKKLSQYFKKKELVMPLSEAMLTDTRAYFRDRNSKFWGNIGTAWENTAQTGQGNPRISITGEQGKILLHKIHGGTIYPARAANLAIPANAQAKAAGSPRFVKSPKLQLGYWGRDRRPHGLVQIIKKAAKGRPAVVKLWYWLVKFANQQADPTAMPPEARTLGAVKDTAKKMIRLEITRALSSKG